jgi:ABC-type hemin transport system substrate-binding protein
MQLATNNVRAQKFLHAAAADGIDQAIREYGDAVSAREAAALRELSSEELRSLATLNQKILDAASSDAEEFDDLSNWFVGAAC